MCDTSVQIYGRYGGSGRTLRVDELGDISCRQINDYKQIEKNRENRFIHNSKRLFNASEWEEFGAVFLAVTESLGLSSVTEVSVDGMSVFLNVCKIANKGGDTDGTVNALKCIYMAYLSPWSKDKEWKSTFDKIKADEIIMLNCLIDILKLVNNDVICCKKGECAIWRMSGYIYMVFH